MSQFRHTKRHCTDVSLPTCSLALSFPAGFLPTQSACHVLSFLRRPARTLGTGSCESPPRAISRSSSQQSTQRCSLAEQMQKAHYSSHTDSASSQSQFIWSSFYTPLFGFRELQGMQQHHDTKWISCAFVCRFFSPWLADTIQRKVSFREQLAKTQRHARA